MNLNERIYGVYFLERFVRMSQNLLPTFNQLIAKKNLTAKEKEELNSIAEIYEGFNVDPTVSVILVNSTIIQLILDVYRNAKQRMGDTPESMYRYNAFWNESKRLIDFWERQLLN